MTSFGWKRKRPLQTKAASEWFPTAGTDDEDSNEGAGEEQSVDLVGWLSAAKRRRLLLLEDNQSKSQRLREEGAVLAENERYWEAIKYWDEAMQLTPHVPALYEMKTQALMELKEVFPAVQAAERAVELDPTWSVARQTLGRAQLGLGEVHMALQNFQKALHLDPSNVEVRDSDLKWAQELVTKKEAMKEVLEKKEEEKQQDILSKRGELKSNSTDNCH